jgi:DNA repair exonuclease SbcCD ATPase subunit
MKLEITNVAIVGFKGYKDNHVYQLGYRTVVTGDNGLGKSSIGEAIVWALTGCNIWGNERATTDLVNNNKPKLTEVVLDFLLDGEPQTIVRRKKGSTNDLFWNEQKVTTNDISRDIFRNKDVFLSIVNPYYFPNLAPKDAKQLLSDVLKPASRDEIFIELGDYLKKLLLDNGFRMPETFLIDARADLKELEDNIVYLQGVGDGAKSMDVLEKKVFEDTKLKSLTTKLGTLKASSNTDELSKLQVPSSSAPDLSELRAQEATIRATLNNISLQTLLPVEGKKYEKDSLLKQYKDYEKQLENMESKFVTCDNCKTQIDLTKETKEILKAQMNEIIPKGKQLGEEIKRIEDKNIEIEASNRKIKETREDEVAKKLKEIEEERQIILKRDEAAEKQYHEKRKSILDNIEKNKAEYESKIEPLKAEIAEEKTKEREVINYNAEIDAAIKHNENLVKDQDLNAEKIKNSKNKIEQLKLAIEACKQYNSIKLKKQSSQIKPYLDKVEIQFEKITKDGELKDDFKIVYEGKEFNKLSASEKIKAGLEVANLLMNIQDLHFPIFVDDAESINVITNLETQMIMAKVTLDKEIKVNILEEK